MRSIPITWRRCPCWPPTRRARGAARCWARCGASGTRSRCSAPVWCSRRWRRSLPPALCDAFELVVAAMLILLGARAIRRALRDGGRGPSTAARARRRRASSTPARRAHVHVARRTFALRPLVVGLVHGLAGSGALTALVLARLPSTPLRFAYMALFSVGSILGMCALSGVAGWPLARHRAPPARRAAAARDGRRGVRDARPDLGLARRGPALLVRCAGLHRMQHPQPQLGPDRSREREPR